MGEKHFVWDEISDGLTLLGLQRIEDEQVKGQKKKSNKIQASEIYCPHGYLILNFQETLNQGEKIKFRKYYLRKVSPNEPNIIILQDIKDLVMFLRSTPVSPQFINFFHLPIVDRFLRAVIMYFQYYVTIWDELMQGRAATLKKAPNPLAQGYRSRYMDEMQTLRCILAREYADLIIGCQDNIHYHHMTAGKKEGSTVTQSQGEKDLRIFEALICMAHRVIWIALERKHFGLIEVELHRLFRTESYNMAMRQATSQVVQNMLEDDILVLQGHTIQTKMKLLRNSPLIQELVHSDCDYRLLSLGIDDDDMNEPRIIYMQNALLVEEEHLLELGIRIGILGRDRDDYDIMLMPFEKEKLDEYSEIHLAEKEMHESKSTSKEDKNVSSSYDSTKTTRLPLFNPNYKLTDTFPIKPMNVQPKGYVNACENARRKWLIREIKRNNNKLIETFSTATSLD